ncbi:unnamed protein product, partial [Prorocentrum cordatum]
GLPLAPSDLRAQHLLDAMTPATRATVTELLAAACKMRANGEAPRELAPHLAGAKLVALEEDDGGLRPIAVGEVLRRLTSKVLCDHVKGRARQVLWPLQTSCCSPLGAEATVHAVRQLRERNADEDDKVPLKLDFANSFHSLHRDPSLRVVHARFPELGRRSEQALQTWTYAPSYLGDGFLVGSNEAVARALATLQRRCPDLGLLLHLEKRELVVTCGRRPGGLADLSPAPLLADAETGADRVVLRCGSKLLGAPIGANDYCEALAQRRADKTKPALEVLANLRPQVGLALLCYCASCAKLVYIARAAPSALLSEALRCFDDGQRRALPDLLAADQTGAQWDQAASHAPGAYLASLAATRHPCCDLDPAYTRAPRSAVALEGQALLAHNALLAPADGLDPAALDRATQKQLSAAVDGRGHQTFLAGSGAADRADIVSKMLPGAPHFLEAQPSEQLGLLFEPEEIVCEVKRRPLMPACETEHFCHCREDVCDRRSRHAGLCADRVHRHNGARNVVGTFATSAGVNPTLEQPGLLPPRPHDVQVNGHRPADVYVPSWFQGASAAFDFAVSSLDKQAACVLAFHEVGRPAQEYELVKRSLDTERQCQQQGIGFIPLVAEPSGEWGPTGADTLRRLARASDWRRGERLGAGAARLFQRLSVAIRRATARAVLRRHAELSSAGGAMAAAPGLLAELGE